MQRVEEFLSKFSWFTKMF